MTRWPNLAVEVLEEFAAHAPVLPDWEDVAAVARERNRERMRELRADQAYRQRERERQRADRNRPQPAVRGFVTARNGLRWTDPGSPWMADVMVEVET